MTYRGFNERREIIPELHQAIVPSYRFTCCGKITEWGVDVSRGGSRFDGIYDLDLQVWRPSPTVLTTGCYSLVGNNRFTSVPLANGVAVVTPSPQEQIQFQPGDVLGFMMENPHGRNGGVVLLVDSPEQDGGYETEEVWHADVSNTLINNAQCPFPVGPGRILTTSTSAAPVISVSYSKSMSACSIPHFIDRLVCQLTLAVYVGTTQCSYNIVATTQAPMSPQPTLIDTSQAPTPIQPMLTDISRPNPVTNPEEPDKPLTPPQPTLTDTDSSRPNPVTNPDKPEKATDSVSDQSATENTDLSHSFF